MSEPTDARNLLGTDDAPIDWGRVLAASDGDVSQIPGTGGPNRHTAWLSTIDPDGRPHVVAIGTHEIGGAWYFTSSPAARKGKNLARDPRCSISIALDDFDLVVEGSAQRVTDTATLQRIAHVFADRGWPAEVRGDAFWAPYNAPTAGPPPWHLFRLEPESAYAMAVEEPGGATRWTF